MVVTAASGMIEGWRGAQCRGRCWPHVSWRRGRGQWRCCCCVAVCPPWLHPRGSCATADSRVKDSLVSLTQQFGNRSERQQLSQSHAHTPISFTSQYLSHRHPRSAAVVTKRSPPAGLRPRRVRAATAAATACLEAHSAAAAQQQRFNSSNGRL